MHSAIALSALLGAGALALPSLQHRHLHDKRHNHHDTNHMDNAEVKEVIEYYTVTITGGQPLPTPQEDAPVVAPQKLAVDPIPQVVSITPTPSSSTPPATSSTPAASSSPPSASVSSTPQDPSNFWSTSPTSPLTGGSGAKDVLTQANYWRQQWKGLPAFEWSDTLAKNAYKTATEPIFTTVNEKGETVKHNEGGAMEMHHNLNPGSMAQCIAGGNNGAVTDGLTPFEHAFLMWICESPTGGLNGKCPPPQPLKPGEVPVTGHADIIAGKSKEIGCYYMDSTTQEDPKKPSGMWTCDFA